MKFLKDYDCRIKYHSRKANLIANVLSRKSSTGLAHLKVRVRKLLESVSDWNIDL